MLTVCRSRLSLDLNSPSPERQTTHVTVAHLMGKQQQQASGGTAAGGYHSSPATTPTTTTTAAIPIPSKAAQNGGSGAGNNNGSSSCSSSGGVIISPRYKEFKTYSSTFDGLQALEQSQQQQQNGTMNGTANCSNLATGAREPDEPPQQMARSLTGNSAAGRIRVEFVVDEWFKGYGQRIKFIHKNYLSCHAGLILLFHSPGVDSKSTPRRGDLAPPLEEDEEQDSESVSRGAPLRQIENNISALLRGEIPIARVPGGFYVQQTHKI